MLTMGKGGSKQCTLSGSCKLMPFWSGARHCMHAMHQPYPFRTALLIEDRSIKADLQAGNHVDARVLGVLLLCSL